MITKNFFWSKRNQLVLLIFLFALVPTYAQKWRQLLAEGETDFLKIKDAFYKEWHELGDDKALGYKHYKRWEYFNSSRLIDGRYLSNSAVNYQLIKKSEKVGERPGKADWRPIGPANWNVANHGISPGIGRVNCIDIHPKDPATIYVGTPSGGLWKSTDIGASWEPLSDDIPILGVSDFYIDPTNPEKMYLLTGDAYGHHTSFVGVYKSTDGGLSWNNPSTLSPDRSQSYSMYKLLVSDKNSDVLVIGGNMGIWKSEDGALTWKQVLADPVFDMMYHPTELDIIYATHGSDFYKSTDMGASWRQTKGLQVDQLGRTVIGVSPDNDDVVYILASHVDSSFGGIYRSVDRGETFELRSDFPNIFSENVFVNQQGGQGWYNLSIAVNPNNVNDIYASGIKIWNSKDGGASWQDEFGNYRQLSTSLYPPFPEKKYVHADNHTLDFLSGKLYAGCDGGIFVSDDLGESWADLSAGLHIMQSYRIGLDQQNPSMITTGAQDNGSNILREGKWYQVYGLDGMETLVDFEDNEIIYTSYQWGGIIKFDGKGDRIVRQLTQKAGSGGWITPFVLDPENHQLLYAGYDQVYRINTVDEAPQWDQISHFPNAGISHLKISSKDPNYIYAVQGELIHVSKDKGATWKSVGGGLPSNQISYITISDNDPEQIWITFSGYAEGVKVYQSKDAGKSWENKSDGLPNLPINCIVHQKDSKNQLYVGTDVGVYEKDNTESTWSLWSNGLPSVIVTELEIHESSQNIVASTFGRGIWKSVLIDNKSEAIQIEKIHASSSTILEGGAVDFTAEITGDLFEIVWFFEGGSPDSSSDVNPNVTYTEQGSYDVRLVAKGINQIDTVFNDAVRVEKVLSAADRPTEIFPNPATSLLFLPIIENSSEIEIPDTMGKMIMRKQLAEESPYLDISQLPAGIFFLRVVDGIKVTSYRFMKE